MDAKYLANGICDSLSSLPTTVYNGLKRTYISSGALTPERRIRNEAENQRFFQAMKALFDNQEPLRRLVNMVIDEYLKKPDRQAVMP